MKVFGTYIKNMRLSKNMSLSELSKITNISISALWNIENNKVKNIKNIFIYRLAKAFNVDYENLLRKRWELFPVFFLWGKIIARTK